MDGILITGLIVFLAASIGLTSHYYMHQDDNPIEEIAEEIIKDKTGWNIDLTPSSLEKEQK